MLSLFLNQKIYDEYSKEPSQSSETDILSTQNNVQTDASKFAYLYLYLSIFVDEDYNTLY